LENGIVLYLLLILNEEEFVEFIQRNCSFDISTAKEVYDCLELTLPEQIRQMRQLASIQLTLSQTQPTNLDSEIKAAEHDLASLQAVRTMTSDMRALGHADDVPVYRSLQEDILAPTPSPDTPTTPRWDSESTR
jgi:hypothetical protein